MWNLAGGQRVVRHPAPASAPADGRAFVTAWDATPDGRTLATGHADGAILFWDVTPPARPAGPGRRGRAGERVAGGRRRRGGGRKGRGRPRRRGLRGPGRGREGAAPVRPGGGPGLRKLATASVEQRDRAEQVLAAYADRRTRVTPTCRARGP
ncbi:hypothetical protein [Limnoglobus roseus]|uniref:hypothetical protein n=1 Tax=Limnoglobus roseus TaxID=2598579 RepID=UPI0011EB7ED3|nr:hypothetical protein [Limnoglobus roseus]